MRATRPTEIGKDMSEVEARRRHLQRARAHIDKSQIEPQNLVFKTVSRDEAVKNYSPTH